MRFFLDHDVSSAVRKVLISQGHDAWNASQAGLSRDSDDTLTIYAQKRDAADLLKERLPEIMKVMTPFDDLFVHVTTSRVTYSHEWS